jgi:hypothetical protein
MINSLDFLELRLWLMLLDRRGPCGFCCFLYLILCG